MRLRPTLLAALAGFVCYANTLGHGFVWDDMANVLLNTHIRSLASIPALFTEHTYAGAAQAMAGIDPAHYYRPLGVVTLALDHALWGERAFGYHLTNLLLHAAACALLARMLLARFGSPIAALAGALLFALHPAHVEAVAWISGRNDLLLVLFALLADLAWLRFRRGGGAWAAAGACLACLGALFSKETAIVVPLLLALEELRAGRGSWWARLRGPAALTLGALGFLALRFALMPPPEEPVPLASRLLTAPQLVAEYLRLLFVPVGLKVFHWVTIVTSAASPAFIVPLAVVLAFGGLTLWLARRDRDLAFGLAWVLVTLLPLAGLVAWPKPTPLAERYLVLPSVGLGLLVAVLVRHAARAPALSRAGRLAVAAATLAIAAGFASQTWAQNRVWHDSVTLLERMTHDAPQWSAGRAALAREYGRAHRWGEAVEQFRAAAEQQPDDVTYRSELVDALEHAGRADDADRARTWLLDHGSLDPRAVFELGAQYERRDRLEDAAAEYRHAIELSPRFAAAYGALGLIRFRQGRWADADTAYARAIELEPGDARSHQNLGSLRLEQGLRAQAIAELEQALRLDPRLPEVHFNLALVQLSMGHAAEAERDVRAGLALAPSPRATLLLARVLVAEGRRAEAKAQLDALLRAHPDPALRAAADQVLAGGGARGARARVDSPALPSPR